ncbi:MAG: sigma-70 family RNA polymerase sigma factor [Chloroflexi bacterium]|nr:MAG: sigma-70 family RNA polymerase sigma factor [Chloroflexota bacterium]
MAAVAVYDRLPADTGTRRVAAITDHEAPLIRRAQAGDRDAFGALYERHESQVRCFLAARLPGRGADIDDLVAETFLVAMQRIGSFELDQPGAYGNWLVGIARNKLLGWRRRDRREIAVGDRVEGGAEQVSPEGVALDRLEVAGALARLTPRARRALVLQHVAGLPIAEIALALGTTKRSILALTGHARSAARGEVRECACGCGTALRPERWGRDRFASLACRRRARAAAVPVLCACGCGAALPAVRAHNRRYATATCRNRAAYRRRQAAQRRYLAAPAAADPAVERVLAVVYEAGGSGTTRVEIAGRTRLLAGRLDRALQLLAARWLVSAVPEPGDGRLVIRYRAAAGAVAGRAA